MNVYGFPMNFFTPHAVDACVFSCIGQLVMAMFIERRVRGLALPSKEELRAAAGRINGKKILLLYIGSTFFLDSIGFALGQFSGFSQILGTLVYVKWIFFLIYGYQAWINNKNKLIFLIMVIFEFSTSLYSYFSTFKDVILMTLMILVTFPRKITYKQFIYGLVAGILLAILLITWTAIKSDYREYLNSGSRKQQINVSRGKAYNKLSEQIRQLNWEKYQLALNRSLYRLQYIYHLAKAMDRVPEVIPHEYGAVWWGNVKFVLTPRLLFPNKPIYEATKKTNKYTGIGYTGYLKGSSFSLGYFADSYVDFGYLGMFIPLALLGLFVAFIYRTLYRMRKVNILFRFAIINVVLYEFTAFEADGLFFFGRLLLMFLVFWMLSKYLVPSLQRWLYKHPS
jgi:hypothetical protein